jgi:hypothetical protein
MGMLFLRQYPNETGGATQQTYLDFCGPFENVVVSLMATLAKQERLRISDRTKAGLNRARRQGKVLGRPRVAVDVKRVRELQAAGMSYVGSRCLTIPLFRTCEDDRFALAKRDDQQSYEIESD